METSGCCPPPPPCWGCIDTVELLLLLMLMLCIGSGNDMEVEEEDAIYWWSIGITCSVPILTGGSDVDVLKNAAFVIGCICTVPGREPSVWRARIYTTERIHINCVRYQKKKKSTSYITQHTLLNIQHTPHVIHNTIAQRMHACMHAWMHTITTKLQCSLYYLCMELRGLSTFASTDDTFAWFAMIERTKRGKNGYIVSRSTQQLHPQHKEDKITLHVLLPTETLFLVGSVSDHTFLLSICSPPSCTWLIVSLWSPIRFSCVPMRCYQLQLARWTRTARRCRFYEQPLCTLDIFSPLQSISVVKRSQWGQTDNEIKSKIGVINSGEMLTNES